MAEKVSINGLAYRRVSDLEEGEARWRDAWNPEKIYRGGQTITVRADLHQIPLFIRVGAKIKLGDLNQEYQESQAIAQRRPDLKTLDAEVKAWFEKSTRESR